MRLNPEQIAQICQYAGANVVPPTLGLWPTPPDDRGTPDMTTLYPEQRALPGRVLVVLRLLRDGLRFSAGRLRWLITAADLDDPEAAERLARSITASASCGISLQDTYLMWVRKGPGFLIAPMGLPVRSILFIGSNRLI